MATENAENKDKAKKAAKPAKKTEETAAAEVKKEKTASKSGTKAKSGTETAKAKKKEAVTAAAEVKPEPKPHKAKDEEKKEAKAVSVVKEDKAEEKPAEKPAAKEQKPAEKKAAAEKQEKKTEQPQKKEAGPKYTPRLKKFYETDVMKALNDLYKYTTPMAIPKVVKVILNIGMGEATQDKSVVDSAVEELTTIAAQKAVKTIARKSISNFHLREGMPIGARVTLRGNKMYDFMDKLISVALPRVRDFKGLSSSSFDGRGNYTIGLKEQLVFPEIDYDKITKIRGMDVTIVTTAPNDDESYQLLKHLGFPFKEKS